MQEKLLPSAIISIHKSEIPDIDEKRVNFLGTYSLTGKDRKLRLVSLDDHSPTLLGIKIKSGSWDRSWGHFTTEKN